MRKIFYWILLPFAYKTKKDRKEFYEKALKEYKNPDAGTFGFCSMIGWHIKTCFPSLLNFPELYHQIPTESYGIYWFPLDNDGFQKRIELLEKAIKMCK